MRAILSCEPGWEVCGEATTGRQALALAFELTPHVIVLDIGLPEMSGLEVTRRVRSDLAVKVLIVTMDGTDRAVQEAINAGANGYMLKADAGRTLLKAVRAILRTANSLRRRARGGRPRSGGRPAWPRRGMSGRLSSREHEVLALLAAGQSNKEVGVALGIATKTVDTHRARIMAKLSSTRCPSWCVTPSATASFKPECPVGNTRVLTASGSGFLKESIGNLLY